MDRPQALSAPSATQQQVMYEYLHPLAGEDGQYHQPQSSSPGEEAVCARDSASQSNSVTPQNPTILTCHALLLHLYTYHAPCQGMGCGRHLRETKGKKQTDPGRVHSPTIRQQWLLCGSINFKFSPAVFNSVEFHHRLFYLCDLCT